MRGGGGGAICIRSKERLLPLPPLPCRTQFQSSQSSPLSQHPPRGGVGGSGVGPLLTVGVAPVSAPPPPGGGGSEGGGGEHGATAIMRTGTAPLETMRY